MPKNLWPNDISKAKAIQIALRNRVKIIPVKRAPEFIAGVDASFFDDKVIAVAAIYKYPGLIHIQDAFSVKKTGFPYIPGLLTFREGPAIINAIEKLKVRPDAIIFDGQGIAHPKGIGIASHIGVILDIPTIGCAKSRLIGDFQEPDIKKGSRSHLYYRGKKVGAVLRTRRNVNPVFVSPGHLIDISSSVDIVMNCISKYRIPEPIRRADSLSRKYKQKNFIFKNTLR